MKQVLLLGLLAALLVASAPRAAEGAECAKVCKPCSVSSECCNAAEGCGCVKLPPQFNGDSPDAAEPVKVCMCRGRSFADCQPPTVAAKNIVPVVLPPAAGPAPRITPKVVSRVTGAPVSGSGK